MEKFDDNELRKRVDEVLYYVWDPVGVCDEPCARGEYESYVPRVLQLVEDCETSEPIAVYLADVIARQMGLTADKTKCDTVAQLLLEHKRAIREGLN